MNKNLKQLSILLLTPSMAWSASYNYNGYINLNARSIKGEEAAADATKYDPKNTVFGNLGAMAVADTNEFTLFANDISADNQGLSLNWRKFNQSSYNFTFSDLKHNLSKNASTGFSGIGSTNLTYTGGTLSTAVSTWTPFNYEVKRTNYGITATNKIGEHFYVTIGANQTEYEGIKPTGTFAQSFKLAELPEAVHFRNTVADFDFGFRGQKSAIALKGSFSHSAPEFDSMRIQDPGNSAATIFYTTSPISKYYKIGLEGSFFDLPLNTTVGFDFNTTKIWNDLLLDARIGAPAASALLFSSSTFKGDIQAFNAKVTAKSRLTENLSSQIYLRFYDRNNDSTQITTTRATGGATNERYSLNKPTEFSRKNAGFVFGQVLPFNTNADLTLDYLDTTRGNRIDVDKTEDYSAQLYLANYYFEKVVPKVQYKFLQTESNFLAPTKIRSGTLDNYQFLRRFDVNDKLSQQIDVGADYTVFQSIKYGTANLSAMAGLKHNSYRHVVWGRKNDNRRIIDANFGYNLPDVIKVSLFAYLEKLTEKGVTSSSITPANATQYNGIALDKVFTYGGNVIVPIIEEKLDAKASYSRYKSDGRVDYRSFSNVATAINANDDYTSDIISGQVDYYWKKYLSFTVGYNYENFDYSDIRVNGYTQVAGGNYYTGAYRDRPFKINEAWAGATYKF